MVAIDFSSPVNLTGMDHPVVGSISYRDDPGPVMALHEHDDDYGSVLPSAKSKPSALRLAFPFGIARRKALPSSPPSPIPKPAPELPVRHKFTFTPSRLRFNSSEQAANHTPAPLPSSCSGPVTNSEEKPQPRHHGHSRHSLLLTKLVWSTRHTQHSKGSSDHHAPGEASLLAAGSTSPKTFASHARRAPLLRCLSSFYPEEKKPDQTPLTMYPRQGDVAALRNPYCARADRSFAPVPLWTLNKIVWVLALLLPRPKHEEECGDEDDAQSEMSFNGTEATLVDSDSDWETSTTCSSRQDASSDLQDTSYTSCSGGSPVAKCDLLSLAVRQVNREPDASTVHMANPAWLCRFYRDPRPESIKLSLSLSRNRQRNRSVNLSSTVWPGSWYGLWELLIELAHRDDGKTTNVGNRMNRDRTPEAKGVRKAMKVPQPKEFRWLKMLGSSRVGSAAKGSWKGGVGGKQTSGMPVVHEPSHSACG